MTGWIVGKEACRICGYTGVAVVPLVADMDNLECANCGHMTSEIIEICSPGLAGD